MRERTACFTGHRIIPQTHMQILEQKLDEVIATLIKEGIVFFGTGMADGFDLLAAQAVLRARDVNPDVKLIAVIPCANQCAGWDEKDKAIYQEVLYAADKQKYVSTRPYFDGCMRQRNLHLVSNSSVCIAYKTHEGSGTSQTVRFAREQSLRIINLAELVASR